MPTAAAWCLAFSFTVLCGGAHAQGATAQTVTGPAQVEDADILGIGKTRIILWGLYGPEPSQTCPTPSGRDWGCYESAMRTLEILVDQRETSCVLEGEPHRFDKMYGTCHAGDKETNEEVVLAGMASVSVDQLDRYLQAQEEARAVKVGLWQEGVEFRGRFGGAPLVPAAIASAPQ